MIQIVPAEDAHFIVRAVNGYDDMLAALISVRARFQHLRLGPDEEMVLARVSAAIDGAQP